MGNEAHFGIKYGSTLYFLGYYMTLSFVKNISCFMYLMGIVLKEGKTKGFRKQNISDIIELINYEQQVSNYSLPLSLF